MKHFIAVLATLAVVATVVALGKKDDEKNKNGASPITEFDNIEDLNKITGVSVKEMEGAVEQYYCSISTSLKDLIGQYMFTRKGDFTLRYLNNIEDYDVKDISGVYQAHGTLGDVFGSTGEVILIHERCYWTGWIADGVLYSLYGENTDYQSYLEVLNNYLK